MPPRYRAWTALSSGGAPPRCVKSAVRSRVAGVFGGPGFRHRYGNGDEVEWTVVVFECEVIGGVLAPLDGEAVELRYFAPNDAPQLQLAYPRELFRGAVAEPLFTR